jgi:molecular chaperone GrpE (heat shock protein)
MIRRFLTRLRDYDLVADNARGLRRALDTQNRAVEDLHRQLEARDAQIERVRDEYAALEKRHADVEAASVDAERVALFKRLQPIATQLPTLRAALDEGADVSGRDVVDLLSPLEEALRDLGFVHIGEAGKQVAYDPKRHKAVGRGADSLESGDLVRVRYVGYLYGGKVVCKAEVTPVKQEAGP